MAKTMKSPFAHDHPTSAARARIDNQLANIDLADFMALKAELKDRGYTVFPTSRVEDHPDHWLIRKTDFERGIKHRSKK
jgi:hypothetical protein